MHLEGRWKQYSPGLHFPPVLVKHHHYSLLFHVLGFYISVGALNIHSGYFAQQFFLFLLLFYLFFGFVFFSVWGVMIFTSVVLGQLVKGGQTDAWILGFHSARAGMVYHPSVGPPLQLCGGLLKAGSHSFI